MRRKIEKLLCVVSEMQFFNESKIPRNNQITEFTPGELTESDLDMVAAASQMPNVPDFLHKQDK